MVNFIFSSDIIGQESRVSPNIPQRDHPSEMTVFINFHLKVEDRGEIQYMNNALETGRMYVSYKSYDSCTWGKSQIPTKMNTEFPFGYRVICWDCLVSIEDAMV